MESVPRKSEQWVLRNQSFCFMRALSFAPLLSSYCYCYQRVRHSIIGMPGYYIMDLSGSIILRRAGNVTGKLGGRGEGGSSDGFCRCKDGV